jgi:AcrR family transcriptional regulator
MSSKFNTKPRKLPRQDRSRITVEAILEATAHILREEGYEKTNTNRIAERAGISIGSLYQYFPNKESLITALIEQHSREMGELVETKLADLFDAPLEIVVPELVKAVIAAHTIDPRLHRVLSEEMPQSGRSAQMQQTDDRIAAMLRAYLDRWRDVIHPPLGETHAVDERSEACRQTETSARFHPPLGETHAEETSARFHPQNLDLIVFILSRTVESLCHAAVIERSNWAIDSQFEREVSNLLLAYLTRNLVNT